jgi:small basic protein
MIVLIGAAAGLALAILLPVHIPPEYTKYAALAILAMLDSIVGGIVASMKRSFDMRVFASGVLINSLVAAGFAYLGSKLDIDISIAAVVAFGARIFQNIAIIRRLLLNKYANRSKIEESN